MEKLKVLYAEDDPLTVMEVAEQLEERGFEVIVATNGTEALKLGAATECCFAGCRYAWS